MSVKYIFCITTGRSGSDYLYRLFDSLDGCNATHEPKPIMNGNVMRKHLEGDSSYLKRMMASKLSQIESDRSNQIYFESNHCFIKGFGWIIPDHISAHEIGVIILKRDKEKVVNSFERISSTPLTDGGRNWLISPDAKTIKNAPVSKPTYYVLRYLVKAHYKLCRIFKIKFTIPFYASRKSRQLLEWYYDEVYRMAEKYVSTFPNINYIELKLDEINTPQALEKILNKFKLSKSLNINEKTLSILGNATNLKEHGKIL